MTWWPPEPDWTWRLATVITIGVSLVVVVIAALTLAYDFLRDYFDPTLNPNQTEINERLRNLPGSHKST